MTADRPSMRYAAVLASMRQRPLWIWAVLCLCTAVFDVSDAGAAGPPAAEPPDWHGSGQRYRTIDRTAAAHRSSHTPHPSVVRVIVPERNGQSYGTGTLVDVRDQYGLVVTNWHVVRDAVGDVTVVFPDGYRSAARPLKVDSNWDLAALVIWRPEAQPVPLASSAPQPGDVLMIAGYGQGTYRAATGRCTQYVAPGLRFPYEMVEVNVQARQGDSGGPIFNERGELAGVLFGAGHGTTSGSYCGRVSGFLASLVPDLGPRGSGQVASRSDVGAPQQPSGDLAELEEQPPQLITQRPADRPARRAALPARRTPPVRQRSPVADPAAATPDIQPNGPVVAAVATRPAGSSPSMTWKDLAGETYFEQAKTVLALIGVLALVMFALRLTAT